MNNKAFANVAVNRSFQKYIICDSNSLSEAIKVYVDFIETPASERDLLDEPKCPKVDSWTSFFFFWVITWPAIFLPLSFFYFILIFYKRILVVVFENVHY